MTKVIPDKIFRNITDERYLWIYNYARKLYKTVMENTKHDNLDRQQIKMIATMMIKNYLNLDIHKYKPDQVSWIISKFKDKK